MGGGVGRRRRACATRDAGWIWWERLLLQLTAGRPAPHRRGPAVPAGARYLLALQSTHSSPPSSIPPPSLPPSIPAVLRPAGSSQGSQLPPRGQPGSRRGAGAAAGQVRSHAPSRRAGARFPSRCQPSVARLSGRAPHWDSAKATPCAPAPNTTVESAVESTVESSAGACPSPAGSAPRRC